MIFMVYVGVFLLVYGIYHLIAYFAYFPSVKSGKSICGFWRAMCMELVLYIVQRFSLVGVSSGRLKKILQLNQEKKQEMVWLLEKCIGSIGVFCFCIPLLLAQPKAFLLFLGAGLFAVWYELLLYCVKSMRDKRMLQRELPFFLLLRWKCLLEKRDKSEYLEACQMAVAEEFSKDKWELLEEEYAAYPQENISVIFTDITIDAPETYYQKQFEFFRRKRVSQVERGIKKRCICRRIIRFIAMCSFGFSVFWRLKSMWVS